jgi:glucokinase
MAAMAEIVMQGRSPCRVAIAFAGPVDANGRVLAAPTVWGPDPSGPVDLAGRLTSFWPNARIDVVNDVTAAGYRYLKHPHDDLCVVTISSGIGHKIFVDGRPVTGPHGRGGEIGHWRVDWNESAPECDCGSVGHLGAVASGRASRFQISRLAGEAPQAFRESRLGCKTKECHEDLNNRLLGEGFGRGDPFCVEVVRRMSRPLGSALAALHLAVGVERFVIIGGFALALGPAYLECLARAASAAGWDRGADWTEMLELGIDDDLSGLIGAGKLVSSSTAGR